MKNTLNDKKKDTVCYFNFLMFLYFVTFFFSGYLRFTYVYFVSFFMFFCKFSDKRKDEDYDEETEEDLQDEV